MGGGGYVVWVEEEGTLCRVEEEGTLCGWRRRVHCVGGGGGYVV